MGRKDGSISDTKWCFTWYIWVSNRRGVKNGSPVISEWLKQILDVMGPIYIFNHQVYEGSMHTIVDAGAGRRIWQIHMHWSQFWWYESIYTYNNKIWSGVSWVCSGVGAWDWTRCGPRNGALSWSRCWSWVGSWCGPTSDGHRESGIGPGVGAVVGPVE